MAEADQDQKTEAPSEKRLHEAHERGQFAKSHELTVLFPLAAALGVLALTARSASHEVAEYAASMFTRFATMPVQADTIGGQIGGMLRIVGDVLAPMLLAITGAVLLAHGVQSGFQLTPNVAGFKPENLNPIAGFSRIFSRSVLMRGAIDLLKLIAIGTALWLGARALFLDPLFSARSRRRISGRFCTAPRFFFSPGCCWPSGSWRRSATPTRSSRRRAS